MDFKERLSQLNILCDKETMARFQGYMEDILRYNREINLTAITEPGEFITKHYLDSLTCAVSAEFAGSDTVIDVGTGGGFPGIPLAIAFPDKDFTLVDSLNKRLKIIDELAAKYRINNVRIVHGRAEDLAHRNEFRETFDMCVSRAVANLSTLSEYCLPFVRVGGWFLSYKGDECDEEIAAAGRAIDILGGRIDRMESAGEIMDISNHKLIYIRKEKETLSKYPRKAGTPSKKPL